MGWARSTDVLYLIFGSNIRSLGGAPPTQSTFVALNKTNSRLKNLLRIYLFIKQNYADFHMNYRVKKIKQIGKKTRKIRFQKTIVEDKTDKLLIKFPFRRKVKEKGELLLLFTITINQKLQWHVWLVRGSNSSEKKNDSLEIVNRNYICMQTKMIVSC